MKKIVFIVLLFFMASPALAQLDPLYNQYQFNQLMINPAYAGIYNRLSASFISRIQWTGIEGAPKTNTLTFQTALKNGEIGLGGLVISDQLGINDNLETQLAASYNIQMREGKLGMGLQGGMVNYRYDLSRLTLDFVDDERLLSGLDNLSEPNFGVGFMYLNENFQIGFSVPRILAIPVNDGIANSTRYSRHYYLTAGYIFEISTFNSLKINSLIRLIDKAKPSFDLSISSYLDKVIWAGVTVRDLRDFGLFISLEVGKNLHVSYSFELPTTSLIRDNYGTHEFSFTFDIPRPEGFPEKRRF